MNYQKKYNADGKVAVLYSPGFGAGWYSWNTEYEGLLFDSEIVDAVLNNNRGLAHSIADRKYPDAYLGGYGDLTIAWLNPGDTFEINEYDGSESVHVIGQRKYLVA